MPLANAKIFRNIFALLKKHNEIIALTLLCLGVFFYGIGLNKIGKNFGAQSFVLIGGAIFILCNFKKFSKIDLKILAIPLICVGILLILALLTYFDTILPPKNFAALIKTINSNILGYFVYFIVCYLFARYADRKLAWIPLYCLVFICVINVSAMIYLVLQNGFYHENFKQNVPFFFPSITAYNVWIPLPLAISLAGIFVFKAIKARVFFICCFLASIIAMIGNGERSFFVAFAVMIFIPFFVYKYAFKKWILLALCFISIIFFYSIYHFSKDLPPRYNAHNAINNLNTIWNTPPIEMGKYDKSCFGGKWLKCSEESIKNGPSEISLEHSALSRINMTKSTLLAFLDKPFTPRVPDVLKTGQYLHEYYKLHNPQNGSYIKSMERGKRGTILYYNHTHNFIAGLLFCYGIIGFMAIVVSMGYLLFIAYKGTKYGDSKTKVLGLALIIFMIGLCVHICFDAFLVMMIQTIFIILGLSIGILTRNKNIINQNSHKYYGASQIAQR